LGSVAIPVGSAPTWIGWPTAVRAPGLKAVTVSASWLVTKPRRPSGVIVIRDGPKESSIVSTTCDVLVSITAMPPPRCATNAEPPSGEIATPSGSLPTGIGSPTGPKVAVSRTVTVSSPELAT